MTDLPTVARRNSFGNMMVLFPHNYVLTFAIYSGKRAVLFPFHLLQSFILLDECNR